MSNATDEKYNAAESEGDRMLNHCRICQLLSRATRVLGVIFCLRWYRYIKFEKEQFGEVHGRKWKNGPDPCGNLLYKLVKDNDKVSDVVKNKLRENDIDDWDVTVLNCAILTVSNALWGFGNWPEKYKEVGKKLKILTDTRNHLQHLSKCQLTNAEFSHYWSVIADVLISFGYDADKLDKLKNWLMQLKFVPSKPLDTLPRAERLKEKANHLYKRNQFTESIRIYSKILAIPELSDENRARILTRRSNAYLMEKGRHSYSLALQDAEEAVQLWQETEN